uniref:prospero homeobox protein 1-like n=1 Tax=Styela clava TaxID=7725 RepID=UPI00193A91DA|nr:prospero homeobox protein 1-like [Styela clava]
MDRRSYPSESETSPSPTSSNDYCFEPEIENNLVNREASSSAAPRENISVIKKNESRRGLVHAGNMGTNSAPSSPLEREMGVSPRENRDFRSVERKRRYSDIASTLNDPNQLRNQNISLKNDTSTSGKLLNEAFSFIANNFSNQQRDTLINKRRRSDRINSDGSTTTDTDSILDETEFVVALKQELAAAIKNAVETSALRVLEKFEVEKGFLSSQYTDRQSPTNDSDQDIVSAEADNKQQNMDYEQHLRDEFIDVTDNSSQSQSDVKHEQPMYFSSNFDKQDNNVDEKRTRMSGEYLRYQASDDSDVFEDSGRSSFVKKSKPILLPTDNHFHRSPKIETSGYNPLQTNTILDQAILETKHRNFSYPPLPIPISLSQAFGFSKVPPLPYATGIPKFGNVANLTSVGQLSPTIGTIPTNEAFAPTEINRQASTQMTNYRTYMHANKLPKPSPFGTYSFPNLAFVPEFHQRAQFAAMFATMNQRIRNKIHRNTNHSAYMHHMYMAEQQRSHSGVESQYGPVSTRPSLMTRTISRENCFRRSFSGMMQDGLTPQHLKKAKLMFFYTRYPNANTLKTYFPDVKFTRAITSQLIKWFSNFREFFYIQMEKFARQAVTEGVVDASALFVSRDSEIFRVLNIHYNKCSEFNVPEQFLQATEASLREFFKAVRAGKDSDPAWKKVIYKIICKLDMEVPDLFKSSNVLDRLHEL